MLTEAEAATKRCPMSFPASQGVTVGGYSQAVAMPAMHYGMGGAMAIQTAPLNCIGSACMAWRVGVPAVAAVPGRVVATDNHGKAYHEKSSERPAIPAKGYCGLARV